MRDLNSRIEAITGTRPNLDDAHAAAELVKLGQDVLLFDRTIDKRFTMVPNELVDNRSPFHVSHDAAGCWVHMQQLGPEWAFSVAGFETVSDDGLTKVKSQLKQLELKGWVLCFRRRERGRWTPGSFWCVMDDPRRAASRISQMAGMGLELITKIDPKCLAQEPAVKPQVRTRCTKQTSGSDLGIVENSPIVENSEGAESAPDCGKPGFKRQNPRSRPDVRKPHVENRTLNNIESKSDTEPQSEASQRSDSAPPQAPAGAGGQTPGNAPSGPTGSAQGLPQRKAPAAPAVPPARRPDPAATEGRLRLEERAGGAASPKDRGKPKNQGDAARASRPNGLKALRKLYPRPTTGTPERLEKEIEAYGRAVAMAGSQERLVSAVRGYLAAFERSGKDPRYMPSLLNFLEGRGYLEAALADLDGKDDQAADALYVKRMKRVNRELPMYSEAERPVLLAFAKASGEKQLAALAAAAEQRGGPDSPEFMRLSMAARNKPYNRAFALFACQALDERRPR